jgi:hypothetical protein
VSFHQDALGLTDNIPVVERVVRLVGALCFGEGQRCERGQQDRDALVKIGEGRDLASVQAECAQASLIDQSGTQSMLRTFSRAASALNSGQRSSRPVSSIRKMDWCLAALMQGPSPSSCWRRSSRSGASPDFDDVTEQLEHEGLAKFEKSWSELGATVAAELDRQHHDRTGG